ncbi:hypothetical protein EDB86DRAFT_3074578 [Lactarius hatsudake]|nr:hypothetical protein EDB86DRAFT_3074578 [Lactarius hatsudake]
MATLSAILRGALRSPAALRSGSHSLNGIDAFPLHQDLDHPLTEGGAILLMCQQLGGLYNSNRNHPDKSYPDSYFDQLTTLLDSKMHQVLAPSPPAVPAQPPLKEVDTAQITAAMHERLILAGLETMRLDEVAMGEIKEAMKAEIFANMNAEALQNIDEWRALYKHEFTEAMHTAFETQYLGIHPNKGKARAVAPLTHSQVVWDAQPRIQEEIKLQVEAHVAGIHTEIKESIANNDPFWGEGLLREAIAADLRAKTQAEVQCALEEELNTLKVTAQDELDAFKAQLQYEQDQVHEDLHAQAKTKYDQAKKLFATNLEADIHDFKSAIINNVKEWKDTYRTSHNLSALKREARRFSFNIVPIDEGSTAAEKVMFQKYVLPPIEVDGCDISVELTTTPSPAQTPFLTPDNLPHALLDPNVTPTPTWVKHTHMEEPAMYLCIMEGLFLPVSSPTPTPHVVVVPLPPSSPMEEDLDYALEVIMDRLHEMKPGLSASIHAPASGTNHSSRVHSPSAPPQGAARDAQSERQPTAPILLPLNAPTSRLEELSRAPSQNSDDNLTTILAVINATISGLEGCLTERLNAQDKRIAALTVLTTPTPTQPPTVTGKRAKGQGPVAANPRPNPRPNTLRTPSVAHETLVPVPRVDDPASHDRVEEISTPGIQATTSPEPLEQPHIIREAFQPPPPTNMYDLT